MKSNRDFEQTEPDSEDSDSEADSEAVSESGSGSADYEATSVLYRMHAFLVENDSLEKCLYFYDEEKKMFERSDMMDRKTLEEFRTFDVLVGFYEKEETV